MSGSQQNIVLGVARGNFRCPKYVACLELWLGDIVVIQSEEGDWMRGYRIGEPAKVGIFPKCYVYLREPKILRIVEEAVAVVDEWSNLYLKYFKQAQTPRVIKTQRQISELIQAVIERRRKLVSGSLTEQKLALISSELARCIDLGNHFLGLDFVVRDQNKNIYSMGGLSIVKLYREYEKSMKELKENDPLPEGGFLDERLSAQSQKENTETSIFLQGIVL